MKYLVYDDGKFTEFNNWSDTEYFLLDKPLAKYKKITSKKVEAEFRMKCQTSPVFKQKIYVVIVQGKVYRFSEWKDAKEFIELNPGAKYKSFEKEEDAEHFSNMNVHGALSDEAIVCESTESGKIILRRHNEIIETFGIEKINNPIEMELACSLEAIKKAIEMKEEQILIICKYLGTEMWANGTWNATKPYSINYNKTINEYKKLINIDFKCIN